VTFFRKGKLRKIFIAENGSVKEVDLFKATEVLRAEQETPRKDIPKDFYVFLGMNKKEFELATVDEVRVFKAKGGRSIETKLLQIIKAIKLFKGLTDEDEEYLAQVIKLIEEGSLPKQTAKTLVKEIGVETNPLKILAHIRRGIPKEFFTQHISETAAETSGPREVILSEYLISA
jgi:hypothetical protein